MSQNSDTGNRSVGGGAVGGAVGGSSTYRDRVPGIFWYWYYKDAIKSKTPVPPFEVDGRKRFFGFMRSHLSSSNTFNKENNVQCIVFFPRADHTLDNFATSLSSSFKTIVSIGKNSSNIHIFVTCKSLEEFDKKTERIPSGIQVWADIEGKIADKFGMRPMIQVIDVADMLKGGDAENRKYNKETISGMFFITQNTIVKSPAYQPIYQAPIIGNIKNTYEAIESMGTNSIEKITSKDSYGADITESELQTRHKKAWDAYQREYRQMCKDLGKDIPEGDESDAETSKTNSARKKKKKKVNKKVQSPSAPKKKSSKSGNVSGENTVSKKVVKKKKELKSNTGQKSSSSSSSTSKGKNKSKSRVQKDGKIRSAL